MLLPQSLLVSILLTLPQLTFSYNAAHEPRAHNAHKLYVPTPEDPSIILANGLTPESVVTEDDGIVLKESGCLEGQIRINGECQQIVGSNLTSLEKRDGNALSAYQGAQKLTAATLAIMMTLFADLSQANYAGISRMNSLSSAAAAAASSSPPPIPFVILPPTNVQFVFPTSTPAVVAPPPPSSTPLPSSTRISTSPTHASSSGASTVSPTTPSTTLNPLPPPPPPTPSPPTLPDLLANVMPNGGIVIDAPSIFPTFAPVPAVTPVVIPSIPEIFPDSVNIPTVFPVFPVIPPSAKSVPKSNDGLKLPPPPSSNCVNQYTKTDDGAVYGPNLGDFPMNPRPSTFVKKSGSRLTLDGQPYRIVGPNIYWLGLDENVSSRISYPSQGRVREAMAITVAMGGNTIRSHTLGVSTGNSFSVWPSNGQTNEAALKIIDYAIWAARNYGLRLIIPLTDDYQYYHGGKFDFIKWAGLSTNDPWAFYTSDSVIKLYKAYISVILNRVNSYTGVAYKDDPTILAWETGNELGAYFLSGGAPPASWTSEITKYIKSIAPNHLVSDGTDGLVNSSGDLATKAFQVSEGDLITDHFYPAENWLLAKDNGFLLTQSKNYFVGELDWTGNFGGDSLSSFYSQLESMSGSGSMIWSVFGHDDSCCNYVAHNDGYSLEYPNGNNDHLQSMILLLIQHWARMNGSKPPNSLPAVACPQPELLK